MSKSEKSPLPPLSASEPLNADGVAFLCRSEVRSRLDDLRQWSHDPLRLASHLAGFCSPQERRWLMDYLQLLPRLAEKFALPADPVCDRLAYEQSTARDLGCWKAALWPAGASLHDLCCGMGGDSFFVAPSVKVQGFDLDPARVAMYRFNMHQLGWDRDAMVQDVRSLSLRADFFCVDPARRSETGQNQRDWSRMTPSLDEILELASRYDGGMVKLPPGFPLEMLPRQSEILFLGARNDCRECLLLLGSLVQEPGRIRAVALDGSAVGDWQGCAADTVQSLPVAQPGAFLVEPRPVLVRSHLFVPLALRLGMWQIDSGLAYLSCDELPSDMQGLVAYPVLDYCLLATGAVRSMLRRHGIGRLTLKKRGVEVIPEAEIRRLAPRGEGRGVLFYTRIQGEKHAILAQEPLSL